VTSFKRPGRIWIPEAPNIILVRTVEPEEVNIASIGIQGLIGWELIRDGKVIRKSRLQPNLITDAGMNDIGSVSQNMLSRINYMHVGTSSTAPDVTQTNLIAPHADPRINASGGFADESSSGASFDYWYRRWTRVATESQYNGNLTEVGFFNTNVAGVMFNRQLFKDDLGAPTTVVKTAADQLKVIIEWRLYANKVTLNQSINISGVVTDVNTRARDIDAAWGFFANIGIWAGTGHAWEDNVLPDVLTGFTAGANVLNTTSSVAAYTSGTFYRDLVSVWDPAIANFATGIGGVNWWNLSGNYLENTVFNPKVAKTNTKRFTFTGRISWNRHP
jgi:hypothetical protein